MTTVRLDDRMPPIETLSEPQQRAVAEFLDMRGWAVRGPFVPLLRSPELLTRVRALGDYLRFQTPLPAPLRELAILMTARKWSQPYEWNAHYAIAREQGLPAAVCDAIGRGAAPEDLSADQRAVFAFCRELLEQCAVEDATYDDARACLGESMLVDLIGLVGYYTLLAMVLNVARTPLPPDAAHQLPARQSLPTRLYE